MSTLNFTRPYSPVADYTAQPLAFVRLLGELDGGDITPKNYVGITGVFGIIQPATSKTSLCLTHTIKPKSTALDYWDTVSPVVDISGCLATKVSTMPATVICSEPINTAVLAYSGSLKVSYQAMCDLGLCEQPTITPNAGLFSGCLTSQNDQVALLKDCRHNNYSPSQLIYQCTQKNIQKPVRVKNCNGYAYKKAIAVPCEYYPIAIPDTPTTPHISPCDERADANELPLTFTRQNIHNKANLLPLPFVCVWRDEIPIKDSYMIINTIYAEFDGEPLQLIDASIYANMDGFCWQFNATLYPDDFAKLNMNGREHGMEAEILIKINNIEFIFIAEDVSDNRAFGRKTYTIQGRSLTAKLSADYAKSVDGVISSDLYARQIGDLVLDLLAPFRLQNWQIIDWLIPQGTYTISDMTPIAVISDIATAVGGFVESDKSRPELIIKPRWKVPAWQINSTHPNLTLPESIIESISGQKQISTQCNSLFVLGDEQTGVGADVFRSASDKKPRASAIAHALYTDLDACRYAGIAALSATGTHKIETVNLPFAKDYGVEIPQLGDIIEIRESTGYWRGVVCGIRLELNSNNSVATVSMSLTIDRYLDS